MFKTIFFLAALSQATALKVQSGRFGTNAGPRSLKPLESSTEDIAADKLVFDIKTGRFYERNIEEICAEEFCLIDTDSGKPLLLTREEKERIFLDAVQSYYATGKSGLPDTEFDKLKEDLSWEGSDLVTLNRDETKFMNAMEAYNKGSPIMSNAEFDALKKTLKDTNSKIAVEAEPKCYVDTGICKVTWTPDLIRTYSLYVPASLIIALTFIGGFYLIPFFQGLNPLIPLALGFAPGTLFVVKPITENVFFKNPFVARGPCPSCNVENKVFFGDVLGVQGTVDESTCKCTNCKAPLTIKRTTLRVSTLLPKEGKPRPAQPKRIL